MVLTERYKGSARPGAVRIAYNDRYVSTLIFSRGQNFGLEAEF